MPGIAVDGVCINSRRELSNLTTVAGCPVDETLTHFVLSTVESGSGGTPRLALAPCLLVRIGPGGGYGS